VTVASIFTTADPAATPAIAFDLNGIISGGTGAGIFALVVFVIKLVLDRTIPSRSDARANVTIVLEGLSNMVKVLQEEKIADAARLADKQKRIDTLESAADKDFESIGELRKEILDLRTRLATKDRHIGVLVHQLRLLGAVVTGIELDEEDDIESLEITLPGSSSRHQRGTGTPEVDITK
jgi:hypothetical protein